MTDVIQYDCENLADLLDFYIDAELPAAEASGVDRHLSGCAACAQTLEARKAFRNRLRSTVRATPVPPGLAGRVYPKGRPGASAFRNAGIMALAAGVLVTISLVAYALGHLRITAASQDAYVWEVAGRVSPTMSVGLKDHVHCTVFRKFPVNPPAVSEMAAKLGADYADLLTVVEERIPAGCKVMLAHKCRYRGRQYIHIVARDSGKLVSLVIARRDRGEAFESDLRAVVSESGVPVYSTGVQRFALAGFETRDHLVYLISDLDSRKNLELMRSMTAQVSRVLLKLES